MLQTLCGILHIIFLVQITEFCHHRHVTHVLRFRLFCIVGRFFQPVGNRFQQIRDIIAIIIRKHLRIPLTGLQQSDDLILGNTAILTSVMNIRAQRFQQFLIVVFFQRKRQGSSHIVTLQIELTFPGIVREIRCSDVQGQLPVVISLLYRAFIDRLSGLPVHQPESLYRLSALHHCLFFTDRGIPLLIHQHIGGQRRHCIVDDRCVFHAGHTYAYMPCLCRCLPAGGHTYTVK